jgi:hypothetical protein
MHVDFDPIKVEWSSLTAGGDEQLGGYNIFRGVQYQRGSGLGSVFRSFLRYLVPIGKQIGMAVGHEGLRTGNRVLSNVLEGKDLKETLVNESKAGIKNLLDKAASNMAKQKGQGFDFKRYRNGDGPPPSKLGRLRKKDINRMATTVGPPNFMPIKHRKTSKKQKRLRVDALGPY